MISGIFFVGFWFGVWFMGWSVQAGNLTSPTSEVSFLQEFYNALHGHHWTWKYPASQFGAVWDFSTEPVEPCNNWQGVVCEQSPYNASEGVIFGLTLDHQNLTGQIPDNFSALPFLSVFSVHINMISGRPPTSLCALSDLTYLAMGNNYLTGEIPPCYFQNLTKLDYLSLFGNFLEGSLPPVPQPMQLAFLSLDTNLLTGPLPDTIHNLGPLEVLHFDNNFLSGNLDVFSNMTTLKVLALSTNGFDSTIPSSLGRLYNMQSMYLHQNLLVGSLPNTLGNFSEISYFTSYTNLLTGTVPESLSGWSSIVVLTLDDNLYTGTLPASLSALHSMEQFTIYNNIVSGTIPPSYSEWEYLQLLLIQENVMSGSLTDVFNGTRQRFLQTIDISTNHFTGLLPEGAFTESLLSFSAFQTCFFGTIPSFICNSFNLEILVLDGITSYCAKRIWPLINESPEYTRPVNGGVPQCIWHFRNISTLHLSGNDLEGTIPDLPFYGNLTNLDLSYNQFVGTIPSTLQNWTLLQNLNLQNNRFNGEIDNIGGLHYRYKGSSQGLTLKLSNNRLSGIIPNSLEFAEDINIVDGNLFTCSAHHQPPYNDPNSSNYVCGSNMLDFSLFAFTTVGSIFALCVFYCIWIIRRRVSLAQKKSLAAAEEAATTSDSHQPTPEDGRTTATTSDNGVLATCHAHWVQLRERWISPRHITELYAENLDMHNQLLRDEVQLSSWRGQLARMYLESSLLALRLLYWRSMVGRMRSSEDEDWCVRYKYLAQFLKSVAVLRQIVVLVSIIVAVVTVPLYDVMKGHFGTYTNQYRWWISGAFFSGWQPALAILLLWMLCLYLSVQLIDWQIPRTVSAPLIHEATRTPQKELYAVSHNDSNSSRKMSTHASKQNAMVANGSNAGYAQQESFSASESISEKISVVRWHDHSTFSTGTNNTQNNSNNIQNDTNISDNNDKRNKGGSDTNSSDSDPPRSLTTITEASTRFGSDAISGSNTGSNEVNRNDKSVRYRNDEGRRPLRKTIFRATETIKVTLTTGAEYWRKPSVWVSIFALFFNIIIVIAIKAAFIYLLLSSKTEFSIKVLIEMALAAVDICWTAVLVPILVNRLPKKRATGRMLLKTCMLYFNSIFAPCVVIAVVDTSCFNGLFFKAARVQETFLFTYCYILDPLNPLRCLQYGEFSSTRYYTPQFIYNYDCYSAVVTEYIPIFLISYGALSFFVPIISLFVITRKESWSLLMFFPKVFDVSFDRLSSSDPGNNQLERQTTFSQMHHSEGVSMTSVDRTPGSGRFTSQYDIRATSATNASSPQLSEDVDSGLSSSQFSPTGGSPLSSFYILGARGLLYPAFILSSAIHHLLVLLTFGVFCPSLAISVAVLVISTTLTWETLIGRWLTRAACSTSLIHPSNLEIGRLRELNNLCEAVCCSPRKCLGILCFGSALFYVFALLDMAGDKQKWPTAVWAPAAAMSIAAMFWLWFNGRTFLAPSTTALSDTTKRVTQNLTSLMDAGFASARSSLSLSAPSQIVKDPNSHRTVHYGEEAVSPEDNLYRTSDDFHEDFDDERDARMNSSSIQLSDFSSSFSQQPQQSRPLRTVSSSVAR